MKSASGRRSEWNSDSFSHVSHSAHLVRCVPTGISVQMITTDHTHGMCGEILSHSETAKLVERAAGSMVQVLSMHVSKNIRGLRKDL